MNGTIEYGVHGNIGTKRSLFSFITRLLNILIAFLYWHIVVVRGGAGHIGSVIQTGAPNVWGAQINASKLAISVLVVSTFVPFTAATDLLTLFGISISVLAWTLFIRVNDRSYISYTLIRSSPFIVAACVRAGLILIAFRAASIEWRLWDSKYRTRDFLNIIGVLAGLSISLTLFAIWHAADAPEFHKP